MRRISDRESRDQLDGHVDRVIAGHEVLHVTRRRGGDFVVMALEDFEAVQETLAILKDDVLMAQVRRSLETMRRGSGRVVELEEL